MLSDSSDGDVVSITFQVRDKMASSSAEVGTFLLRATQCPRSLSSMDIKIHNEPGKASLLSKRKEQTPEVVADNLQTPWATKEQMKRVLVTAARQEGHITSSNVSTAAE